MSADRLDYDPERSETTTGMTQLGRRWRGWIEERDGVRFVRIDLLDTPRSMEVQWDASADRRRTREPVPMELSAWAAALEARHEREAGAGRKKGERR